jgi:PIN domain nuclease of toxin-antitoxin system
MRLLLDTHVFLWYITADPRLPAAFRAAIEDATNQVYLSAASLWEAVVKHGLGKLPLAEPPAEYWWPWPLSWVFSYLRQLEMPCRASSLPS